VRSEVLTAVMMMILYWAVTACGLTGRYQALKNVTVFVQSAGIYIRVHMVSHPRTLVFPEHPYPFNLALMVYKIQAFIIGSKLPTKTLT
jgi:hypothetical protein